MPGTSPRCGNALRRRAHISYIACERKALSQTPGKNAAYAAYRCPVGNNLRHHAPLPRVSASLPVVPGENLHGPNLTVAVVQSGGYCHIHRLTPWSILLVKKRSPVGVEPTWLSLARPSFLRPVTNRAAASKLRGLLTLEWERRTQEPVVPTRRSSGSQDADKSLRVTVHAAGSNECRPLTGSQVAVDL